MTRSRFILISIPDNGGDAFWYVVDTTTRRTSRALVTRSIAMAELRRVRAAGSLNGGR